MGRGSATCAVTCRKSVGGGSDGEAERRAGREGGERAWRGEAEERAVKEEAGPATAVKSARSCGEARVSAVRQHAAQHLSSVLRDTRCLSVSHGVSAGRECECSMSDPWCPAASKDTMSAMNTLRL
eukprot:3264798-Rhodomonas_salina.1